MTRLHLPLRSAAVAALLLLAPACSSADEPDDHSDAGRPDETTASVATPPAMPPHEGLTFTRGDGSGFPSRVFRRVTCTPAGDGDGFRWVRTLSRLPHNTYVEIAVPVVFEDGRATYLPEKRGGDGRGVQVSVDDPSGGGMWHGWRTSGQLDGDFELVAAGCGKRAALAFTIDAELPGWTDALDESAVAAAPLQVSGAVSAPFHYRDR